MSNIIQIRALARTPRLNNRRLNYVNDIIDTNRKILAIFTPNCSIFTTKYCINHNRSIFNILSMIDRICFNIIQLFQK